MNEKGEVLITIIGIGLAAILMFIFPLAEIANMNDKEVLALVQSYNTEYVNKIINSGVITQEGYDALIQKLYATGNSYEVEIELHIADTNPGKKTENQQVGDTTYYVLYHTQVMQKLESSPILLKEGDYVMVYIKNTNTTLSQSFMALIYGAQGDQAYSIYTQDSGLVLATGQI